GNTGMSRSFTLDPPSFSRTLKRVHRMERGAPRPRIPSRHVTGWIPCASDGHRARATRGAIWGASRLVSGLGGGSRQLGPPLRCLIFLAPGLVELDHPLGGLGQARLAERGDLGLAGLHALVA